MLHQMDDLEYWDATINTCYDVMNHDECGNNALACECIDALKAPRPFNLEKIARLLDCGINVNAKNHNDMTVLMCCCAWISSDGCRNIEEMFELLVYCGADIHIKSIEDKTAFDYVVDKDTISERLSQLLQGNIRLNRTKSARKKLNKNDLGDALYIMYVKNEYE